MTIKFMYVHVFEHIALENYLNEMREKGYLLKGMGWFYLSFQKGTANQPYHVVVSGKRDEDGYRVSDETKKQQDLMNEFGYNYVCGFGHMQVYQATNQHIVEHQMEDELTFIKNIIRKKVSSALLLVFVALVMLLQIFLYSEMDYFAILNFFANRNLQFTLLYTVLLILTMVRKEAPIRAFKKNPQLIVESEKLKGRGLTIFIGFLSCAMMIYYRSSLALSTFLFILMTKWFRKYKNGYLVAVFISSILFHFADGTLVAYQQLKTPPQEVYQVVFEDVTEYESLWLKTILYENEDTRILHIEIKESKLAGVIRWLIQSYYDVNGENLTYHKGTYVRKIDDDTYDLVQCEASKEWQNRLSS